MAIIARASTTLVQTVDISSVTWYYKLQASTASPPAKPTTATPSGWTTTEPTYTEGSTNSLYVCQKTTYSDGSFEYSDVSLSSSYEAAKTAYNKSVTALTAANGKNRNFYLPSTTPPAGATAGDQWFQTDKGNELYKYTGSTWEKVGLTSAVFSTVDAGAGSVGMLSSLLIYKDDDNYWNLSANNYDEDFLQTNVEADIKYRANTLKTNHLVALEDVYVNGGPNSYLRIPTEADELSYVELDNGGMNIKSRMIDTDSDTEFEINTNFPSSTENDGIICHSEMETTRSPSPGDPVEWRDYRTTYAVDGLYLSYDHGTGSGSGKNTTKSYSYSFCYDEITAKEDGSTYLWLNHTALTLGSVVHPMDFYLNNVNIGKIAEAYPSQSGHNGACAVWHESGMCKYLSFAANPNNKTLYVYGSNDPDSIAYIGRVQLV